MEDEFEIRQVDPSEVEAVLAVRLFISAVNEVSEYEFPLSRVLPDPPEVVVTETVQPDGSIVSETRVVHRGVVISGQGQGSCSGWPTPPEQRVEYSSSVSVSGRSADVAVLRWSADWTVPDESGRFDEELVVPWFGSARADLPDGSWVTAEMTPATRADATLDRTT